MGRATTGVSPFRDPDAAGPCAVVVVFSAATRYTAVLPVTARVVTGRAATAKSKRAGQYGCDAQDHCCCLWPWAWMWVAEGEGVAGVVGVFGADEEDVEDWDECSDDAEDARDEDDDDSPAVGGAVGATIRGA